MQGITMQLKYCSTTKSVPKSVGLFVKLVFWQIWEKNAVSYFVHWPRNNLQAIQKINTFLSIY